jgi:hypothetical protein
MDLSQGQSIDLQYGPLFQVSLSASSLSLSPAQSVGLQCEPLSRAVYRPPVYMSSKVSLSASCMISLKVTLQASSMDLCQGQSLTLKYGPFVRSAYQPPV